MNGVINVYKKRGKTSFQVVAEIKKLLHMKKVGHTGTLDPEAEGVLPICVGKATKLVDYIMAGEKTYRATFQLGQISDTLDAFGQVEETGKPLPTREALEEVLTSFIGTTMQRPPMYSALKVEGKRLYELARAGEEVDRALREIHVSLLRLTSFEEKEGRGEFLLQCSKGTYVRSIIDDFGRSLDCGAIMTGLIREGTGQFQKEQAVTLETLEKDGPEKYLQPMDQVLGAFEAVVIPEDFLKLIHNGVKVKDKRLATKVSDGQYRGYSEAGEFLGILEKAQDSVYLKLNLL